MMKERPDYEERQAPEAGPETEAWESQKQRERSDEAESDAQEGPHGN